MHRVTSPCIKEWGPKTQARLASDQELSIFNTSPDEVLYRSISPYIYYQPVDTAYTYILQYAWSATSFPMPYTSKLPLVLQKFAFVYGPSISHPTLQHAVCAIGASSLFGPDEVKVGGYTMRACQALRYRLSNPAEIDEGDLFASFLLAMDSAVAHRDQYKMHVQGFVSIMNHLHTTVKLKSYTLEQSWQTARDHLLFTLLYIRVRPSYFGPTVDEVVVYLCESSHKILGNGALKERLNYQRMDAKVASNSVQNISYICRQTGIWLVGCLLTFSKKNTCGVFRSYLISGLLSLDARPVLDFLNEEAGSTSARLECLPYKYEAGMSNVPFEVMDLISRHLLPLLLVVLNAPSEYEGRYSKAGIAAASSFSAFTRHFESIVLGLPSYNSESAQKAGEINLANHPVTDTSSTFY